MTYTLSGEGSGLFEVSNQGQIKLSASLNHEEMPSYTLTLSVRDSKDGIGNPDSVTDDSVTVNVTVNDVDEPPSAPTDLSISTQRRQPHLGFGRELDRTRRHRHPRRSQATTCSTVCMEQPTGSTTTLTPLVQLPRQRYPRSRLQHHIPSTSACEERRGRKPVGHEQQHHR